jgi:hypothetical protein
MAVSANPKSVAENQQRSSLPAKWLPFISPALAGFERPLTSLRPTNPPAADPRSESFTLVPKLSAYYAAYLGLAMRRGLPLATLDGRLKAAAAAIGVSVYAVPKP